MVVGNTSKYVEGFESFTVDDEIMLANLKQAVNYTKANMEISNIDNNTSNSNNKNSMTVMPPITPQGRTIKTDMSSTKKSNNSINKTQTLPMNAKSTKNNTMGDDIGDDMVTSMGGNKGGSKASSMNDDMGNDMVTSVGGNKGGSKNSSMDDDMDDDMTDDMADDMADDEDVEEGFQGSQQIECQTLRKMLIALLITFIGYMLILGFTNNLIPITTYAPELKQFKHLIYGGFFFLIVYICLEIF